MQQVLFGVEGGSLAGPILALDEHGFLVMGADGDRVQIGAHLLASEQKGQVQLHGFICRVAPQLFATVTPGCHASARIDQELGWGIRVALHGNLRKRQGATANRVDPLCMIVVPCLRDAR